MEQFVVLGCSINTLLHKWCQDTSVPGRFGPETFPHHQTGAEVSGQFGTSLADTLALVPKCLDLQQTLLLQLAVQKEGLILLVIIKEDGTEPFRSRANSLQGTKVLWNFRSLELSLP